MKMETFASIIFYRTKFPTVFYKKEISPDKINKIVRYRMEANLSLSFSDLGYLSEYNNAVNILFNHIFDSGDNLDVVAHPFFYLIRHSVELGLKSNLRYLPRYSKVEPSAKLLSSHNLRKLLSAFKKQFEAFEKIYPLTSETLKQFNGYYEKADILVDKLGEDASTFRYATNSDGNLNFKGSQKLNGLEVKEHYDETIILLAYTPAVMEQYTDFDDLTSLIPGFSDGLGRVYMRVPTTQKKDVANFYSEKFEVIDEFCWKDPETAVVIKVIEVNGESFFYPAKNVQ